MATAALGRVRVGAWTLTLPIWLLRLVATTVVLAALWLIWTVTATRVTVTIDGNQVAVTTHRGYVRDLLLDLGVVLHENDRVTPGLDSKLRTVKAITVERALPAQIVVDGRSVQTASWGKTPREVIEDAGITLDEYDAVVVDGLPASPDDPLPTIAYVEANSRFAPVRGWLRAEPLPYQIRIIRARPIVVDDGTLPFTIRTTAQTVGEALRQAEITIYLGDLVVPSLGSEVMPGLRVTIQRSVPVELAVDGRTIKTRTRGETVADALAELRVGVSGEDIVSPPLATELADGLAIEITRVKEDIEITEEIAPFETLFVPDPNLPIDTQEVVNPGAEGITRTRYRVRYENGNEVNRVLEDTWVAQEPAERRIAYGQRIEPKTFTAPDGTQYTYWRRIRMLATSYSANTAGVSPSASNYGRTYTGDTMRFGIVAVDPSIIPLRSQVFVPEYGRGEALDTGSAIRARRIDLGYDDSNLVLWNKWVDVYLLWPPPSAGEITWVLPNWPRPPE